MIPKLPGKIRATPDELDRIHLAEHGKKLSPIQEAASRYFTSAKRLLNSPHVERPASRDVDAFVRTLKIQASVHSGEMLYMLNHEKFCQAVCAAVLQRDSNALFALAEFVRDDLRESPADPTRAILLAMKYMMGPNPSPSQILPMKEIAHRIGYNGDWDVFRRLLKSIDFPIRKEAGGRPRNSDRKFNKTEIRS